tara:strand:- start:49 stop:615 length:567 start_codon:yes stop_codon:yes gene_type:complete
MNQRNRYAYAVMFTRGPQIQDYFRGKSLRDAWRLIKRRPKAVYQLAGGWLCGLLTLSRHRHVIVADDEVIMDFGFEELNFHPLSKFQRDHHNLNGFVMFYSNIKPDWTLYEGIETSLWYATAGRLLMWATRGVYQCKNCTTVTRYFLECMGVRVPRKCWNPKLLLLWMTENGFTFTAATDAEQFRRTD